MSKKKSKQKNWGGTWQLLLMGSTITGMTLWFFSDWSSLDSFGKSSLGLFFVLGLWLLWIAGRIYQRNKQRYEAFYQFFPELHGSMETVVDNAEFVSERLGVLIYKGFLVSYNVESFNFVIINEIAAIHYKVEGSLAPHKGRAPQAFLEIICEDYACTTIQVFYAFPKITNPLLDKLYQELYQRNPSINFNQ